MFADGDRDWRRRPMPGQFALRVAIMGGVALAMFSVIFFRLWYLQVLSGDKYLKEAENNQVREITVQAPRGDIEDRNGHVLVDNRTSLALQVRPDELPARKRARDQELGALAKVTGMSLGAIEHQIRRQTKDLPANPVTLQRDVAYDLVYYLRENQDEFPGVEVNRVYVRNYPQGTLAAHILGYVSEVNAQQLKEPRYQGLQPGDDVGQAGVESTYDSVLRGVNGITRVQVDASGRPTGGQLSSTPARVGDNLVLSIDDKVQAAGEAALASFGLPGAFVAMNIHNGQILGLGSSPTYDPSIFAKPVIPQATYDQLTSDTTGSPLTDRATVGSYPTGSVYKPITSLAALTSGVITPTTPYTDTGTYMAGDIPLHNAGGAAYGTIDLPEALKVSSDVFFYHLGDLLNSQPGEPLQTWSKQLGIGSDTGIDITGEAPGLLPTPQWRNALYRKHLTDRPWSVGDNINLAVGQGDLQTDPLQVAVAYAAIANGGDVVRPHVGLEVTDQSGRVVQQIQPAPQRHVNINPGYQHVILDALHNAAQSPGGTSYPVFANYPVPIAGKTGTAQHLGQADQSWYAGLAPYPNPDIVVVATIERGGFGVDAAAPTVCKIMNAYFALPPKKQATACSGATAPTSGINLNG
jgi:penicillin-binding protein 2